MILSNYTYVKITPSNVKYWRAHGYDVVAGGRGGKNTGQRIRVRVEELKQNSNVMIACRCDSCGIKYLQRFSRNTLKCAKCRSSQPRSKSDVYKGTLNVNHDEFVKFVESYGKQATAKAYNTTLSVVNNYCKKHDIQVDHYRGLRKHAEISKSDLEFYVLNHTAQEIADIYGVPVYVIRNAAQKYGVSFKHSYFKQKENERIHILNNLMYYVKLNRDEGYTLLQIAQDHNISIEQLKRVFRESDQPVQLHGWNKSAGEYAIREFVESLGFVCGSQYVFDWDTGTRYEIDCYVPSINFGIEYHGEYWHSEQNGVDKKYHFDKWRVCRDNGINLMQIFESEWLNNPDIIKSMIRARLGCSRRVFARNCQLDEIRPHQAFQFFEGAHIHGGIRNATHNYALTLGGTIMAALSVRKARFDPVADFEIVRFASLLDHTVIGGFSRLLKRFRADHAGTLVSYADLRFGSGDVYRTNGFEDCGITPPNYWYFKKGVVGARLENRVNYQKHKLESKLKIFDPNLTETENMILNNYLRIYDCGSGKFLLL